ncbi:MAG: hypothetical protein BZY88_10110 [SAR202 cluster bacterium Io17-Chloro-G9]|nr:MAG: hypothetical protein BZY88_10110 [SAR202 cluster bacterium Io17-Chloro-G9]
MFVFAAILLAAASVACESSAPAVATAPPPTLAPTDTPVPTPTKVTLDPFATAEVPAADPELLANLKELMALVPQEYGSAVYLNLKSLREDPALGGSITPEALGLDSALPSLVAGLVDELVIAAEFGSRRVISGFRGPFDLEQALLLAGSFGVQVLGGGAEEYGRHKVWTLDVQGVSLAMGSADATTGVAGAHQDPSVPPTSLVKQALDAFDGQTTMLLDSTDATSLIESVPSGFAAVIIADCAGLALLAETEGIFGCTGAAVSASVFGESEVAIHALVGFTEDALAATAVALTSQAIEAQAAPRGIRGVGVRQEGRWVRARVVAELPDFNKAFELFKPRTN